MNRERIRRPQSSAPPSPVSEERVRRQIGTAAGTEYFQNRDPLFHVTESFQTTFDAMGQRHAAQEAERSEGSWAQGQMTERAPEEQMPQEQMPDKTSFRSFYERPTSDEQDQLRRFSETSFQRGTLSGAVLRGTGQMMLFSCLKKTVGQNQPDKWQQRKLFERVSQHRNTAQHAPDRLIFNRNFTDSAVGIVVDTLRDARRTVEDLQEYAKGGLKNEFASQGGAMTLQKMYPFLDDLQERKLLEEYQSQLEVMEEGDPKRSIIQTALVRTRALLNKKAQMRVEFINKLRFLSDRATEALEVFGQPEFAEAMFQELQQSLAGDPPVDGGDGDGAEDAADQSEDGAEAGT